MKILITGANGQLGTELCNCLQNGKTELGNIAKELLNAKVYKTDIDTLDITNLGEVMQFVKNTTPDVIISCAAYTNVDGCETNFDDAFKVNAIGARNLSMAAQKVKAKLIHVSTDYVFSGKKADNPVSECDIPAPSSAYGKTKLLGEKYAQQFCKKTFIVRTSWLYGYVGNNFVKTMVRVGKQKGELTVVSDQVGNPTNAADLAHHILKLATTKQYGVYHCTGNGICSWYDFATEIIKLAKINASVKPCTTKEYKKNNPASASRPEYSALDNTMLRVTVGDEMRDWKKALKCYFDNVKEL